MDGAPVPSCRPTQSKDALGWVLEVGRTLSQTGSGVLTQGGKILKNYNAALHLSGLLGVKLCLYI